MQNRFKNFTVMFFLLVINKYCFTQEVLPDSTADSTHFISYTDKLHLSAYSIVKLNKFNIAENSNLKRKIEFSPNENLNLGIGFNYRWMGLGVSFNIPAINNDDTLYGSTSSVDLRVDIFSKKAIYNISTSFYKGYYWENPEIVYPSWNSEDSVIIRPDIGTFQLGLSGLYTKKYQEVSLRSIFVGTEKQLISSGSFVWGWFGSIYAMGGDSTMLPRIAETEFPQIRHTQAISSINIGASAGYTYTYVKGNFFANILVLPGISLQIVSAKENNVDTLATISAFSSKAHFRFGLGFQSEKYTFGLTGVSDVYNLKTALMTRYSYSFGMVRLYYSRRF